jgi:hypothetical protein
MSRTSKLEFLGYSCKGELHLKASYFQQAILREDSRTVALRGVDRSLLSKWLCNEAEHFGTQLERSVGEALKLSKM